MNIEDYWFDVSKNHTTVTVRRSGLDNYVIDDPELCKLFQELIEENRELKKLIKELAERVN